MSVVSYCANSTVKGFIGLTYFGCFFINFHRHHLNWDCSLEWRVHTGFRSAGTLNRIQVYESHTVCCARGGAAIFMEGVLSHTSNAFDWNQISQAVCRQDLACWLWPVQVFSLISDNSHVLHTHTLSLHWYVQTWLQIAQCFGLLADESRFLNFNKKSSIICIEILMDIHCIEPCA